MKGLIDDFFKARFLTESLKTVYTKNTPLEMMTTKVDKEGYYQWKLINGTLKKEDYYRLEAKYNVKFPSFFVEWHRKYYFLDGDCSFLQLPASSPSEPLKEIADLLENDYARELSKEGLYAFAADGNDEGLLVFDSRSVGPSGDFPIRAYDFAADGNLEGLSEIIFSSFQKLIECTTFFLERTKIRKNFEVFPDFFLIDPDGAGKYGVDYWLEWVSMKKQNFTDFGY
ncbi:hypothetical protein [Pedobacter aquatilis]|uniref:hypothetical protein n=1 Tax=Pedobacter aquatilis TaxID=351343 RepID=UPI00292E093B|nr:hypothetical protein [Pedobacter aquatilis]